RAEACSWARARSSPAFFPWCPSRPRSPPSSSRSSTPGASPRAASTQAPRSTTRRAPAASRCRPRSAAAGSSASGPEELDELRVGEQRDAFLRAERARVLRHLAGRDVDAAFGAAALGGCEEIAERLGAGAHGFPALAGDETPHAVSLQVEVTVAAASARNAASTSPENCSQLILRKSSSRSWTRPAPGARSWRQPAIPAMTRNGEALKTAYTAGTNIRTTAKRPIATTTLIHHGERSRMAN